MKRLFKVVPIRVFTSVGCCVLMCQNRVMAQEDQGAAVALEVGVGQSDNLTRETEGGARSAFHYVGLTLGMETERRRFSGGISGDFQLRRYAEESLLTEDDDETLGSLDGYADFDVVVDRLLWNFDVNAGQTRTDPLQAPSPENRENVRILATGPRLNLPVGDRMSLDLQASVIKRQFEDSDRFDSEAEEISLGLNRALSTVSQLSFVMSRNDVEYDGTPATYKFDTAYLSYQRSFSTGGVEMLIGASSADGREVDSSSPITSLRWTRDVGTRSNFSVWASRELTDPGDMFRSGGIPGTDSQGLPPGIELGDLRLEGIVVTDQPMQRTSAGLAFAVTGDRTSISASAGAAKEEFQGEVEIDDSFDNENRFAELAISRSFGRDWTGTASLHMDRRNFDFGERNSEDTSGRLSAFRSITDRGGVQLAFQRNVRSGNIDVSDENVYAVSFTYQIMQ